MKTFILSFLIFILALAAFFVGKGILAPLEPDSPLEKEFVVPRGMGVSDIALSLEQEGLIKNRFPFLFYLFLKGEVKNIKAGRYLFSPSMSIPEILRKLIEGKTIKEKVTIIEGWTKKDIANYLEEKEICSQEEFFNAIAFNKWKEGYGFLKEEIVPEDLEGYLFPDTYFIEKESTCEEIVKQMLDNFDEKLDSEIRKDILNQKKKIFEIVTMASLIEKEVSDSEDRKIVSGILWKRLDHNIPLQVDATITYITGKKTTKVTFEETQIDSPYNTYKYLGLPSAPICNPGIESIKAAAYPQGSEFWYYLSIPDGTTIFSETIDKHNIAKAKYLR